MPGIIFTSCRRCATERSTREKDGSQKEPPKKKDKSRLQTAVIILIAFKSIYYQFKISLKSGKAVAPVFSDTFENTVDRSTQLPINLMQRALDLYLHQSCE